MPNPSFEIYDTCPSGPSGFGDSQLSHSVGWFSPTLGTSDYFNECENINPYYVGVGVPHNFGGYQSPNSGNGYAGFIAYFDDIDPIDGNYTEYISIQLLTPLETDSEYVVEFFISLGDRSLYAIDRIGLTFSDNLINETHFNTLNITPVILSEVGMLLNDYTNWVSIKGFYIANGSENFITLGNFTPHNQTNKSIVGNTQNVDTTLGKLSYYFVDNVKVQKIESWITLPNVFTPNEDGINDLFIIPNNKIVKFNGSIYNRWGQLLYQWDDVSVGWNGIVDNNKCPEGTYFCVIEAMGIEGKEYRKSSFFELLR